MPADFTEKSVSSASSNGSSVRAHNAKLLAFRKLIVNARNKRGAHIDLGAQLNRLPAIGEFDEAADKQFLANLQKFVDIAYRHLFDAPRPIQPGAATDTHVVTRALRKSLLYDACTRCDERQRIAAVLDAEHG